jgi:hypothetical protein
LIILCSLTLSSCLEVYISRPISQSLLAPSGLWTEESLYVSDGEEEDTFKEMPDPEETLEKGNTPHTTFDGLTSIPNAPRGQFTPTPMKDDVHAALDDIMVIIQPQWLSGIGYNPFQFSGDDVLQWWLEMMWVFLVKYIENDMGWKAASLAAVKRWKKGEANVRTLCKWTQSFLNDCNDLLFNLYGTWNTCMLQDGDLAKEILTHLQSIGKYIAMQNVIDFQQTDNICTRYSLSKTISLWTAQWWMHLMDYWWEKEPGGQYVDRHEREDVVTYHQEKYIPFLVKLHIVWPRQWRCVQDGGNACTRTI